MIYNQYNTQSPEFNIPETKSSFGQVSFSFSVVLRKPAMQNTTPSVSSFFYYLKII